VLVGCSSFWEGKGGEGRGGGWWVGGCVCVEKVRFVVLVVLVWDWPCDGVVVW